MSPSHNREKRIDRVKIDHEFGVIQYHFTDGSLMQYTRAIKGKMFDPQITETLDGATAINASVTSEEFDLIIENERKRR